jgi:hypothetical protein
VAPPFLRTLSSAAALAPLASAPSMSTGSLHGENSCFLPLKQLDQDYYAPRIVQVRKHLLHGRRLEFVRVVAGPWSLTLFQSCP